MDNELIGNISIYRESAWRDKLRSYAILSDGKKVGSVKDGETSLIPLSQGRHDIAIKIDWQKSDALTVNIENGKVLKLNVDYKKLNGWKLYVFTGLNIILIITGAALGISLITVLGIVGFLAIRIGKPHLYREN